MSPTKTSRVCRCISSHICVVTRTREQMWFTFCVESVHRIGRAISARPVHSKNLVSVGKCSLGRGIKYRLNRTLKSATAFQIQKMVWDRDSSVDIATRYGLDGPGIEYRCGRDFPHLSRPALGPTQPPIQWVQGHFPEGKAAGAWRWSPTPSIAEVEGRVELYFYSPSGPSWPVAGWNLPLPLRRKWHLLQWTALARFIPARRFIGIALTKTDFYMQFGYRQ